MLKLRLAFKYAFTRNGGQRTTAVMIILGIATSIVAVLVIASVMNGLQKSQLDKMRNVQSFDLIVDSKVLDKEQLISINGVVDVVPFFETNVLVSNKTTGHSTICKVRSLDYEDILNTRLNESIKIPISKEEYNSGVTLSYSIRSSLGYKKDNELMFTFLKPGKTATVVPFNASLKYVGTYSCNVSDFSSSTIIMSNSFVEEVLGSNICTYGLFISDSTKTLRNEILKIDPNSKITTWQEYNKSFYSALVLEKAMMYVFLCFMFLILCVNLRNSTNRLLLRKKDEGAMLRAIGSDRSFVNSIFIYQGLIVTIIGELLGFVLSILIINNIQSILSFLGNLILNTTGIISYLGSGFLEVSISVQEIAFVLLFVFILSFVFVASGCKKVFKKEIMEVLLNESN